MKSIVLLSLLSLPAFAQELKGPSDTDLLNVSFNLLDESKKIMNSVKEADCNDKNTEKKILAPKAPAVTSEEVVCLCELDSKKQSLLNSLIGDYESSSISIKSGNDNFLHGVLQLDPDLQKFDGDDRGRTFNVGASYELHGSEGNLSMKFDSTGFGKFNPQNGYRKDSEGRHYLNFHDVTSLGLRFDKYLSKNEKEKIYGIGEFTLFHESEDASTSRSLQEWWHTSFADSSGHKRIQYHYLKENEARTSVTLLAGIGKTWITDLSKWKCMTKAELKAGATVTQGTLKPEVAARLEATLTHSSVQWIALSTWASAASGFIGQSYEAGVNLSFPIKRQNFTVEPFIGIERHKTTMDKKYGKVSGSPYENYHVFGVTIRY